MNFKLWFTFFVGYRNWILKIENWYHHGTPPSLSLIVIFFLVLVIVGFYCISLQRTIFRCWSRFPYRWIDIISDKDFTNCSRTPKRNSWWLCEYLTKPLLRLKDRESQTKMDCGSLFGFLLSFRRYKLSRVALKIRFRGYKLSQSPKKTRNFIPFQSYIYFEWFLYANKKVCKPKASL